MLKIGDEVSEYIIDSPPSSGNSALVYKVKQKRDEDSSAALKMLINNTAQERGRFDQENEILRKLKPHDAIVEPFTEVEEHEGDPFYVMEYLPIAFAEIGIAPHALDSRSKLAIGVKIAEGLSHAHAHNYVHRDLHYGNIRFIGGTNPGYGAKITDFGRALEVTNSLDITDTQNPGWGAPKYSAPELLFNIVDNNDESATQLCDIHALGLILYNLFMTDHTAYWITLISDVYTYWTKSGLTTRTSGLVLSDSIPKSSRQDHFANWLTLHPSTGLPNAPRVVLRGHATLAKDISEIIAKATRIDPSQRYQSVDAMIEAMRRI